MAEIKRIGPPKARGIEGNLYTWSVELSAHAPQGWIAAFSNPSSWTSVIHPELVKFEHGGLLVIFRSAEQDVPSWIKAIDQWANTANEAVAAQAEEERRQMDAEQARQDERTQRLKGLSEKFKDL